MCSGNPACWGMRKSRGAEGGVLANEALALTTLH